MRGLRLASARTQLGKESKNGIGFLTQQLNPLNAIQVAKFVELAPSTQVGSPLLQVQHSTVKAIRHGTAGIIPHDAVRA